MRILSFPFVSEVIAGALLLLSALSPAFSQPFTGKITWRPAETSGTGAVSHQHLAFSGAVLQGIEDPIPCFRQVIALEPEAGAVEVRIHSFGTSPLRPQEAGEVQIPENLPETPTLEYHQVTDRKQPFLEISFVPLVRDPKTGLVHKVESFTLDVVARQAALAPSAKSFATASVLATGHWVKLRIDRDGLYSLTSGELSGLGFSDPLRVKVYGNDPALLSLINLEDVPDDLQEFPVMRSTSRIVFYAKGPDKWTYSIAKQRFTHEKHLYSDAAYVFLTENDLTGKSIDSAPLTGNPGYQSTSYDDLVFLEQEDTNFVQSGRQWFGQEMNLNPSLAFDFNVPGLLLTEPVQLTTSLAARAPIFSTFSLKVNGEVIATLPPFDPVNLSDPETTFAQPRVDLLEFTPPGPNLEIKLTYSKPTSSSTSWLDYLALNLRRTLNLPDGHLVFRDMRSVAPGQFTRFSFSGSSPDLRVWKIVDLFHIEECSIETGGAVSSFVTATDTLYEFVAFDGSSYLKPVSMGTVPNQNLHGYPPHAMVIVTHPDFRAQVEEVARMHRTSDGLSVLVVPVDEIYNEFSSGAPDLSAIRNFMRMLYEKDGAGSLFKYLLLFGDGSFRNRNSNGNSNFILTYQSANSHHPISSFCSDDFFGLLDPGEGDYTGLLDLAIGRIPVTTQQEAEAYLEKFKSYSNRENRGSWVNTVCFLADDNDNASSLGHMVQSNRIADSVEVRYPVYNVDRIFLDAFQQVSSSSGKTYPDANEALRNRVALGSLLVDYIGHGNETGLSEEQVITMSNLAKWENFGKLPIFNTWTCEFSRFDNPAKLSGGELAFLNPEGGAIALFSTLRPVYSSSLADNFYSHFFSQPGGSHLRLGEVVRITKNQTGGQSDINTRKYALLGDPALMPAFPDFTVATETINGLPVGAGCDTAKALSEITVTGFITDQAGNKIPTFDGLIYPTVYDKAQIRYTLGNEGNNPMAYSSQTDILYKGKVQVSNGDFSFSFRVPRDISYSYGRGKISYYGQGGDQDAAGFSKDLTIGGFSENPPLDEEGPLVDLFMDNRGFRNGGITGENPRLLAYVEDESGINTAGNGIGHDITAIMDGNSSNPLVLNDFYESELDSYKKGIVDFAFSNLEEGPHRIRLKVWDVFNNSGEAEVEFVVVASDRFRIGDLYNFPNPTSGPTSFYFNHNQAGVDVAVILRVYSLQGQLLKTLEADFPSGYSGDGTIPWDGRDEYGQSLSGGLYIFRLEAWSSAGLTEIRSGKMAVVAPN